MEPIKRVHDSRQLLMRISRRVTMTRKMLGTGCNAHLLIAGYHRHTELCNLLWLLAKGSYADDRVKRIIVHIEHRCKIDRYAELGKLHAGYLPCIIGVLRTP